MSSIKCQTVNTLGFVGHMDGSLSQLPKSTFAWQKQPQTIPKRMHMAMSQ